MNMYFIAILLPVHLNEKVLKYKNYMHDKYGCKVGLKSPAHITLISPFWMEEEKEQQLITGIEKLSDYSTFVLTTKSFSAFVPKTIFIALSESKGLNELKRRTDHFFGGAGHYKIKVDPRPFHPHITIATRDLHKKDFAEAWPYFSDRKFEEEWIANGISVLRHNKKNWDVIFTSQFQQVYNQY